MALIEPGSYLDFAQSVQNGDGIVERGLLEDEGRVSGNAQSAVRLPSNVDFDRILALGLNDDGPLLPPLAESA